MPSMWIPPPKASNGYVISEQGKPPDFVLEVASESTANIDTGAKRDDYAALGIAEYWRFDETGEYHGARLAGDRLVQGRYEPIPIFWPRQHGPNCAGRKAARASHPTYGRPRRKGLGSRWKRRTALRGQC